MASGEEGGPMSTQQVAERLGCDPSHVRYLARTGRLREHRISDRSVFYDPTDVARLVAEKGERRRLPKRPKG
jgi:hypothetical protein